MVHDDLVSMINYFCFYSFMVTVKKKKLIVQIDNLGPRWREPDKQSAEKGRKFRQGMYVFIIIFFITFEFESFVSESDSRWVTNFFLTTIISFKIILVFFKLETYNHIVGNCTFTNLVWLGINQKASTCQMNRKVTSLIGLVQKRQSLSLFAMKLALHNSRKMCERSMICIIISIWSLWYLHKLV